MQTYKAIQGAFSYFKNFANIQDAETYFSSVLVGDFTVTLAAPNEQIQPKTENQKLEERQAFGKQLLNDYLIDNDKIAADRGYPFTVEETAQQAAKFQLVMGILPLGSLLQCLTVIQNTATDAIFTQERKDKYIAALQNFIAAQ